MERKKHKFNFHKQFLAWLMIITVTFTGFSSISTVFAQDEKTAEQVNMTVSGVEMNGRLKELAFKGMKDKDAETADKEGLSEAEKPVFDVETEDDIIQRIAWSTEKPAEEEDTIFLSEDERLIAWFVTAEEEQAMAEAKNVTETNSQTEAVSEEVTEESAEEIVSEESSETVQDAEVESKTETEAEAEAETTAPISAEDFPSIYDPEYLNTIYFYFDDTEESPETNENQEDESPIVIFWNADMSHSFANMKALKEISVLRNISSEYVENMSYMFSSDEVLQEISPIGSFKTDKLQDITSMFQDCSSLKDVKGFMEKHDYDYQQDIQDVQYRILRNLLIQREVSEEKADKIVADKKASDEARKERQEAAKEETEGDEEEEEPSVYTAWDVNKKVVTTDAFKGTKVEEFPSWYKEEGESKGKEAEEELPDDSSLIFETEDGHPLDPEVEEAIRDAMETGEDYNLNPSAEIEPTQDITLSEEYILANLNPEYVGEGSTLAPYDIIYTKHTMADKAQMPEGDYTIDGLFRDDDEDGQYDYLLAYIGQQQTYMELYEVSPDAPYVVGYIDTQNSENTELVDIIFALNDDMGHVIDDCIYDWNTGLVYIPKTYRTIEDKNLHIGQVQVQMLYLADIDYTELTKEISVSINNKNVKGDVALTGTADVKLFSNMTYLQLANDDRAKNALSFDSFEEVIVNGTELTEYGFDQETGTMLLGIEPTFISSVEITLKNDTVLEEIGDFFSGLFGVKATAAYNVTELTNDSESWYQNGSYFLKLSSKDRSKLKGTWVIMPNTNILVAYDWDLSWQTSWGNKVTHNMDEAWVNRDGVYGGSWDDAEGGRTSRLAKAIYYGNNSYVDGWIDSAYTGSGIGGGYYWQLIIQKGKFSLTNGVSMQMDSNIGIGLQCTHVNIPLTYDSYNGSQDDWMYASAFVYDGENGAVKAGVVGPVKYHDPISGKTKSYYRVPLLARIMDANYDASSKTGTVVLGLLLATGYTQAGQALLKLRYKLAETSIQIHKVSDVPLMTDGDPYYDVSGATFAVYKTREDAIADVPKTRIATLTTDKNGYTQRVVLNTEGTPGTYYVRELSAPAHGYYVDFEDVDKTIQSYYIEGEGIFEFGNKPWPKAKVLINKKMDNNDGKPITEDAEFTVYEWSDKANAWIPLGKMEENQGINELQQWGCYAWSTWIHASEDNPEGKFLVEETKTPLPYEKNVTSLYNGEAIGWSSGVLYTSDAKAQNAFTIEVNADNDHKPIHVAFRKEVPTLPGEFPGCTFVAYPHVQEADGTGYYDETNPTTFNYNAEENLYWADLEYNVENKGMYRVVELTSQEGLTSRIDKKIRLPYSHTVEYFLDVATGEYTTSKAQTYQDIKDRVDAKDRNAYLPNFELTEPGIVYIKKEKTEPNATEEPANTDAVFGLYEYGLDDQGNPTWTRIQKLKYDKTIGKYKSTMLWRYDNPESTEYNDGRFAVLEEKAPNGETVINTDMDGNWFAEFQIQDRTDEWTLYDNGTWKEAMENGVTPYTQEFNFTVINEPNKYSIHKLIGNSEDQYLSGVLFMLTYGDFALYLETGDVTDPSVNDGWVAWKIDGKTILSYKITQTEILLSEMVVGTYTYREVDVPNNYQIDENTYTITIDDGNRLTSTVTQPSGFVQVNNAFGMIDGTEVSHTQNVHNFPRKGYLILKVSSEGEEHFNNDATAGLPIQSNFPAGTEFDIYEYSRAKGGYITDVPYAHVIWHDGAFRDSVTNDYVILTGTEDNNSTFKIQEVSATDGYMISNRVYDETTGTYTTDAAVIHLPENTDNIANLTIRVQNTPNKFRIYKVDENGNPLAACHFIFQNSEGNSYEIVSATNGYATIYRLTEGTWTFWESEAAHGYSKDPNQYTLVVTKDGGFTVKDADGNILDEGTGEYVFNMSDTRDYTLRVVKKDANTGTASVDTITNFPVGSEFMVQQWSESANKWIDVEYLQHESAITVPGTGKTIPKTGNEDENSPLIAVIDTGVWDDIEVEGKYSVLNDANGFDDNGHGSLMIRTIYEQNPNARIVSIKALDEYGFGTAESIVAALDLADQLGADIINLSFTASKTEHNMPVVDKIQALIDDGKIVVGAAGNNNANADNLITGCIEDAIVVAACDNTQTLLPSSNIGGNLDVAAEAGNSSEATAKVSGFLSNHSIESLYDTFWKINSETLTINEDVLQDSFVVAASISISGWDNSSGRKFTLTVTEQSVDTTAGTSTVKWELSITNATYSMDTYVKCTVNGTVVYNPGFVPATPDGGYSWNGFPANVGSTSGTLTVAHNSDGTKTISFAIEGYAVTYTTKSASGTLTLTNITPKSVTIYTNAYNGLDYDNTQIETRFEGYVAGIPLPLEGFSGTKNEWGVLEPTETNNKYKPTWFGNNMTANFWDTTTMMNPPYGYRHPQRNVAYRLYDDTDGTWIGDGTWEGATLWHENGCNLNAYNGHTLYAFPDWQQGVVYYHATNTRETTSDTATGVPTSGKIIDANGLLATSSGQWYGTWPDGTTTYVPLTATTNLMDISELMNVPSNEWLSPVEAPGYGAAKAYKIYDETDGKWLGVGDDDDPNDITKATPISQNSVNLVNGEFGDVSTHILHAYPQWVHRDYDVTYNANGGTGAPAPQKKVHGTALPLSTVIPTRIGYKFVGWATSATSTTIAYRPGEPYQLNAPLTLYAIWTPNQYIINYDVNGGALISGPLSKAVTYSTAYGDFPVVRRAGYTQDGWHKDTVTGATITDTTIMNTAQNHTLVAKWVPNTYSVVFHNNGGVGTMANQTFTYDDPNTTTLHANTFTKEKFTFVGWSLEPDGNVVFSDAQVVQNLTTENNGVINLYAIWDDSSSVPFVDKETAEPPSLSWTEDNQGKFRIVERQSTPGYVMDGSVMYLLVNKNGGTYKVGETDDIFDGTGTEQNIVDDLIPVPFANTPNTYTIQKIDQNTRQPLAGATFRIWKEDTPASDTICGYQTGFGLQEFAVTNNMELVTNDEGQIVLTKLGPGTYHYQETAAPAGYSFPSTTYTIYVDANSKIGGTDTYMLGPEIPNQPDGNRPSLTLIKTDSNARPLKNVDFTLTSGTISKTLRTDNNGIIDLTDYVLGETVCTDCHGTGLVNETVRIQWSSTGNKQLHAQVSNANLNLTAASIVVNGAVVNASISSGVATWNLSAYEDFVLLTSDTIRLTLNNNSVLTETVPTVWSDNANFISFIKTNGSSLNYNIDEDINCLTCGGQGYLPNEFSGRTSFSIAENPVQTALADGIIVGDTTAHTITVTTTGGNRRISVDGATATQIQTMTITNSVNQVRFHKTDENGQVLYKAGTTFRIWSQNREEEVVTKSDGYTPYVVGLEAGTWYYQETKNEAGYQINDEIHSFIVNDDGTIENSHVADFDIEVTNIKNKVKIKKIDDSTPPRAIPGVQFRIIYPDGHEETRTTGTDGYITLEELPDGIYKITEKESVGGYIPSKDTYILKVQNGRIYSNGQLLEYNGEATPDNPPTPPTQNYFTVLPLHLSVETVGNGLTFTLTDDELAHLDVININNGSIVQSMDAVDGTATWDAVYLPQRLVIAQARLYKFVGTTTSGLQFETKLENTPDGTNLQNNSGVMNFTELVFATDCPHANVSDTIAIHYCLGEDIENCDAGCDDEQHAIICHDCGMVKVTELVSVCADCDETEADWNPLLNVFLGVLRYNDLKYQDYYGDEYSEVASITPVQKAVQQPVAVPKTGEKIIAVIDTGVNVSDEKTECYSVLNDNGIDENGHGGRVISAIYGQNADAKVISIKALDKYGFGKPEDIIAAINLAKDLNADIINLSFVASKTESNMAVIDTIQTVSNDGITVVASAGNNEGDVKDYVPACIPCVIVVAACNAEGTLLPLSNSGNTVDLAIYAENTSIAAAIVSGQLSKTSLADILTGADVNFANANASTTLLDSFTIAGPTRGDGDTVTITYTTDGNGVITGITTETVDESAYPSGTTVTPNNGYLFHHWTADVDCMTGEVDTITVSGDGTDYTFELANNNLANIKFYRKNNTQLANINAVNGIVTWTPTDAQIKDIKYLVCTTTNGGTFTIDEGDLWDKSSVGASTTYANDAAYIAALRELLNEEHSYSGNVEMLYISPYIELTDEMVRQILATKNISFTAHFAPERYVHVTYKTTTGEDIATAETLTGLEGTAYDVAPKIVQGWDVAEIPSNSGGFFTEDDINVNYVYQRAQGHVLVQYMFGDTLLGVDNLSGPIDSNYNTSPRNFSSEGYEVSVTPSNANGVYTLEDITVTYQYIRGNSTVTVRYQDEYGTILHENTTMSGQIGTDYTTTPLTISGYQVATTPINQNGTYTLAPITVTYIYSASACIVNVEHRSTSNELLGSSVLSGQMGAAYQTNSEVFEGYTLQTTPSNATGAFSTTPITVTYIYQPAATSVTARYINVNTGGLLAADVVQSGHVGDSYTTTAKTISGFQLVETPANATGIMTASPIMVTYNYTNSNANKVIARYSDESGVLLGADVVQEGQSGASYTTQQKTISGYTLRETPSNQNGQFINGTIIVSYIYTKDTVETVNTDTIEVKNHLYNLRIVKVDADNKTQKIDTALFTINGGTPIPTINGEINQYNLAAGTYIIQEVQSPDGYRLDMTPHSFVITSDGKLNGVKDGSITFDSNTNTITITHTNEKNLSGSVTINKQDELTGRKLEGVKFGLYEYHSGDEGHIWTWIGTVDDNWITGTNGIYPSAVNSCPSCNTEHCNVYYCKDCNFLKFACTDVEHCGHTWYVDNEGHPMATLNDTNTGMYIWKADGYTDVNGQVQFDNIPVNWSNQGRFLVKEELALDGYQQPTWNTNFTITKGGQKDYNFTVSNMPNAFAIQKTDENYAPLIGANFEFWIDALDEGGKDTTTVIGYTFDGAQETAIKNHDVIQTDYAGQITLYRLLDNSTYSYLELAPPENSGYFLPDEPPYGEFTTKNNQIVRVVENESIQVTESDDDVWFSDILLVSEDSGSFYFTLLNYELAQLTFYNSSNVELQAVTADDGLVEWIPSQTDLLNMTYLIGQTTDGHTFRLDADVLWGTDTLDDPIFYPSQSAYQNALLALIRESHSARVGDIQALYNAEVNVTNVIDAPRGRIRVHKNDETENPILNAVFYIYEASPEWTEENPVYLENEPVQILDFHNLDGDVYDSFYMDGTLSAANSLEFTENNNGHFKIVEVATKDGYFANWSDTFTINLYGEKVQTFEMNVTNSPNDLRAIKTDQNGVRLRGAAFNLKNYVTDGGSSAHMMSASPDVIPEMGDYVYIEYSVYDHATGELLEIGPMNYRFYIGSGMLKVDIFRTAAVSDELENIITQMHPGDTRQVTIYAPGEGEVDEFGHIVEDSVTYGGQTVDVEIHLIAADVMYDKTIASGTNTYVDFTRLPAGYYVLTETSAPDGFVKSDEEYYFIVENDGYIYEAELNNNGSLTKVGEKKDLYEFPVENTPNEFNLQKVLLTSAGTTEALPGVTFQFTAGEIPPEPDEEHGITGEQTYYDETQIIGYLPDGTAVYSGDEITTADNRGMMILTRNGTSSEHSILLQPCPECGGSRTQQEVPRFIMSGTAMNGLQLQVVNTNLSIGTAAIIINGTSYPANGRTVNGTNTILTWAGNRLPNTTSIGNAFVSVSYSFRNGTGGTSSTAFNIPLTAFVSPDNWFSNIASYTQVVRGTAIPCQRCLGHGQIPLETDIYAGQIFITRMKDGTWFYRETAVPEGTQLDNTVAYRFSVQDGVICDMVEYPLGTIKAEKLINNIPSSSELEIAVFVEKLDYDTNAKLEGAVFTVQAFNAEHNAYETIYQGTRKAFQFYDTMLGISYEITAEEFESATGISADTAQPGDSFTTPVGIILCDEVGDDPMTLDYLGDGLYGKEGLAFEAINQGKFRIVETQAPNGHAADWQQDIDLPQSVWEFTGVDAAYNKSNKLIIEKVDTNTKNPLANTEIKIWTEDLEEDAIIGYLPVYDNEGDKIVDSEPLLNGQTVMTDENGQIILVSLTRECTYYMQEITPPSKDYVLNVDVFEVYVQDDGLIEGESEYTVTITNSRGLQIDLPMGGVGRFLIYFLGGLLLAGVIVGSIILIRKNKKEEDAEEKSEEPKETGEENADKTK